MSTTMRRAKSPEDVLRYARAFERAGAWLVCVTPPAPAAGEPDWIAWGQGGVINEETIRAEYEREGAAALALESEAGGPSERGSK